MLDLLDQSVFQAHETFFFEPSCGDGEMLVIIVDRIFNELMKKYGDEKQALADILFKFYATEIDEELVPKARKKIYDWAVLKMDRELTDLEIYLIARSLQSLLRIKTSLKLWENSCENT